MSFSAPVACRDSVARLTMPTSTSLMLARTMPPPSAAMTKRWVASSRNTADFRCLEARKSRALPAPGTCLTISSTSSMTMPTAGSSGVGWNVECPVSARVADRLVTSRHSADRASAMLLRTSSSVATGPHSVRADSGSQTVSSPMCAPFSWTSRASVHRVMNSRTSLSTVDLPLPVVPITPAARPPISLNRVRVSAEPSSGQKPQITGSRMLAVSGNQSANGDGPASGQGVVIGW